MLLAETIQYTKDPDPQKVCGHLNLIEITNSVFLGDILFCQQNTSYGNFVAESPPANSAVCMKLVNWSLKLLTESVVYAPSGEFAIRHRGYTLHTLPKGSNQALRIVMIADLLNMY